MKRNRIRLSGIITGIINSVIGACGGIIVVESLIDAGFSQKKAQATAISIMLPLTAISAGVYYAKGYTNISDSVKYILPGIAGAIVGAKLLTKASDKALRVILSIFIIYAGVRMFFK